MSEYSHSHDGVELGAATAAAPTRCPAQSSTTRMGVAENFDDYDMITIQRIRVSVSWYYAQIPDLAGLPVVCNRQPPSQQQPIQQKCFCFLAAVEASAFRTTLSVEEWLFQQLIQVFTVDCWQALWDQCTELQNSNNRNAMARASMTQDSSMRKSANPMDDDDHQEVRTVQHDDHDDVDDDDDGDIDDCHELLLHLGPHCAIRIQPYVRRRMHASSTTATTSVGSARCCRNTLNIRLNVWDQTNGGTAFLLPPTENLHRHLWSLEGTRPSALHLVLQPEPMGWSSIDDENNRSRLEFAEHSSSPSHPRNARYPAMWTGVHAIMISTVTNHSDNNRSNASFATMQLEQDPVLQMVAHPSMEQQPEQRDYQEAVVILHRSHRSVRRQTQPDQKSSQQRREVQQQRQNQQKQQQQFPAIKRSASTISARHSVMSPLRKNDIKACNHGKPTASTGSIMVQSKRKDPPTTAIASNGSFSTIAGTAATRRDDSDDFDNGYGDGDLHAATAADTGKRLCVDSSENNKLGIVSFPRQQLQHRSDVTSNKTLAQNVVMATSASLSEKAVKLDSLATDTVPSLKSGVPSELAQDTKLGISTMMADVVTTDEARVLTVVPPNQITDSLAAVTFPPLTDVCNVHDSKMDISATKTDTATTDNTLVVVSNTKSTTFATIRQNGDDNDPNTLKPVKPSPINNENGNMGINDHGEEWQDNTSSSTSSSSSSSSTSSTSSSSSKPSSTRASSSSASSSSSSSLASLYPCSNWYRMHQA